MALITAIEIREIMDDTTIPDALIAACMAAAEAVIDKVFEGDGDITDTLKKEISRWFTAHMVASTPNYRTTIEEKVGEAQVKYTGKYADFLSSTPFGQMTLQLDVTGKMANYAGKRSANIYAITSFDE
jgi:hypothetical protein